MSSYIHIIVAYLNHHPMVGLAFTFFIAMIESIAILGTIIPGMLTMTVVGMLAGSGVMPIGLTLLISILGALTGDFLTYWFGFYFREHIYEMWPFRKYRKFLSIGEKFFAKHGGKSVVIGRFVGPVRSMVPLIAGLLNMRPLPFTVAAIISATSWSIIYMFPGVFLGALSTELPKWKALEFLGYGFFWIFLLWTTVWLIQYFIRKSWKYIDNFLGICWLYLKEHPRSRFSLQLLVNPKNPHDHRQFTLLFLGLVSIVLFGLITTSVYFKGFITQLNSPLFYLLQSFRTPFLDHLMLWISFLFSGKVLIPAAAILSIIFMWKRAFWMGFHFLGVVITSALFTKFFKWLIHVQRPDTAESLAQATDIFSSYPSGHVSLSLAVFGFSSILIATELKSKRRVIPYILALMLVLIVAFSRLYLGAHWLTDVLGGFFLSAACVLLFTVSYRRFLNHGLSARFLIVILSIVFTFSVLTIGIIYKKKIHLNPQHEPTTYKILKSAWWKNEVELPLYRDNRFGKPIQLFNLSWLGDIKDIRKQLLEKGWVDEQTETDDFKKMLLKQLIKPKESFKLPILPSLYQGKSPVLIMTRKIGSDWAVLELWKSYIQIQNTDLWIGVAYTLPHPHKWFIFTTEPYFFKDAIQPLLSDIKNTAQSKILKIQTNQLPKKLGDMKFDKDVYLIKIYSRSKNKL